jgi:hypothetical protein
MKEIEFCILTTSTTIILGSTKEDGESIVPEDSPTRLGRGGDGSTWSASPISYQRSLVSDLLDEDVNIKNLRDEGTGNGDSFIESEQVEQLLNLTIEVLDRTPNSKEPLTSSGVGSDIDAALMAISTLPSYDEYVR